MKKMFFALAFFSMALCCFAQVGLQFNGSDEASLFHSGFSLPLFGSDNIFTNQSSALGNSVNSLEWGKSNFELTPFSSYKDESFWKATSSTMLPIIVGAIGLIMAVVGIPVTAFEAGGVIDTKFLGPVLMVGGAGIYALCFFVW